MKYRIVKRQGWYYVQEKFLGFMFWTDSDVHPIDGFSIGYKTKAEAEASIKPMPEDIIVGYYN